MNWICSWPFASSRACDPQLPILERDIKATQYSIAALLGQYPEDLAQELAQAAACRIPAGGRTRSAARSAAAADPTSEMAERQLAAATARIGVATANLFPHVAITGGLGTQSADIGAHGSHIWAFGPAVYWPLLDFGTLDAMVSIADLQAHERLIDYRTSIIAAVQDADTAIANFDAQERSLDSLAVPWWPASGH